MTNYNLEEFKTWINQSEVRKNTPEISDYINTLKTVSNWTQYLEIIRGRSSFSDREHCLKLFKEWLREVDEQDNAQTRIRGLQQQITNLTTEKNALTERMVRERQEALNQFNQEKNSLISEIEKLEEQKETYARSAGYLRETLRDNEKTLEEVKTELALSRKKAQSAETEKQQVLSSKEEELKRREEAFKVVSERNGDLQSKLNASQQEINKLSEWISKLESASVEGDAFAQLKKDLESLQAQKESLSEQLSAKKGRDYWWIYLIIALIGIYLVVK